MAEIILELEEWSVISPTKTSQTNNLFLENNKTIHTLVEHLKKSNMIDITELKDGLQIQTFSYVGFIKVGDILIRIKPKIKGLPLFNLLRYAYDFRHIKPLTTLTHNIKENLFQDILIYQMLLEIEELIFRGLKRNYVRHFSSLSFIKGKVAFNRIVKTGGINKALLPCVYYTLSENHLINQILLAGICLAIKLTSNKILQINLQRYKRLLEESVQSIQLSSAVLAKVNQALNRLVKSYESILSIIEMLYQSQSVSFEENKTIHQMSGFLFNMNSFFQKLISRFLKDNIENYWVREEHSLKDVMSYNPKYNPQIRRSPMPRPDIVIGKGNDIVSILDAKYRDLWKKRIPREMLYQLSIYSLLGKKKDNSSTIIYPTMSERASKQVIDITEPLYGNKYGDVILKPFNLLKVEKMITSTNTSAIQIEKKEYAKYLAFD